MQMRAINILLNLFSIHRTNVRNMKACFGMKTIVKILEDKRKLVE